VVADGDLFQLNLVMMLSTTLTAAKAKWRERKKLLKRIKGVDLSVLTCKTDSNIRPENSMDNWC
jgi:hypothetical protein